MRPLCLLSLLAFMLVAAIFLPAQTAYAQEYPAPESLVLTVYPDGVVHVDYVVAVNPESSMVNVELFGKTFESLSVTDENGIPLENDVTGNVLGVATLGASRIYISYDTPDLTSKTGRYWTLTVKIPVKAMVILPPEAVIISLSQVPESIESREGQIVLVMPRGLTEITYTISVAGTREHALVLIREAENRIGQAKASDLDTAEAESLLAKAKAAFDAGNYAQAEAYAKQAIEAVKALATTTATPPPPTGTATPTPSPTGTATPTPTETRPPETVTPQPAPTPAILPIELIVGVIVAVMAAVVAVLVLFRRKPSISHSTTMLPEPTSVDLDRILAEWGDELKIEDQQALQTLADNGGRMFESELKEKLNLPRTTIWRMVKRLEKLGIVRVRKILGQNLIQISEKYLAG